MSQFSFSKAERLISKLDFAQVFDTGKKKSNPYCLALYIDNALPHARLGVLISKKQIKLAVNRNRIRRIARESFRHHKESLKGIDIVLQMRSKCVLTEAKHLRAMLDKLWSELII